MTLQEMVDKVSALVAETRLPGATGLFSQEGKMICYGDSVSISAEYGCLARLVSFRDASSIDGIVLKVYDTPVIYLPDGSIACLEMLLPAVKVIGRGCPGCDSPLLRNAPMPWAELADENS